MSETLAMAWAAGVLLGGIFFGGLWWTVRKGISSKQPALWFFGSVLLRTSVTLGGFYFVSGGHWERLLSSVVGFLMASLLVMWLTGSSGEDVSATGKEANRAPHPG
jgi:F1F0 ATPase subunit 2